MKDLWEITIYLKLSNKNLERLDTRYVVVNEDEGENEALKAIEPYLNNVTIDDLELLFEPKLLAVGIIVT